ncbi:MAG: alanine--tRNA ligase, partial [Candidatus Hydrogenedentes bacterium]|nr:alanine--tRNA ligase [Candidatus Hydrogenedentota bacterium]
WEFSSKVLNFDPKNIVVTVYKDDDEAYDIWRNEIGIDEKRLYRLGDADNFWGPAGDTGACGPCSELLYDKGEHIDPDADPENDPKERFLEFWNLVFPQFDQQADGSRPPLKNRGIDTGMGLERLAALLQGKETVFDTDGIFPIIEATAALTKVAYKDNPVPYRVIADHARAISFMIADGILPGNEGRGYVERRLLRRAARFGRELGLNQPFLYKVVPTVIELMGAQYPELVEKRNQIVRIIQTEEERFGSTLARGMGRLDDIFAQMKKDGVTVTPGEDLFKLHDTYGFPLDLATDIAEDQGYTIDRDGFNAAMAEQKNRGREGWAGSGQKAIAPVYDHVREAHGDTDFKGYDCTACDATIQAIIFDTESVNELTEGQEGEIVLNQTPFYGESGGQVGDTGVLDSVNGNASVANVKKVVGALHCHAVTVKNGVLKVGDKVEAVVDARSRKQTENHHTATHLLQAALQNVIGDHVHQAGSMVSPDRLRFDFTHFEGIDTDRLEDIERLVNDYIRRDEPVVIESKSLDDARAAGAMALFGEKYGDVVRVVTVGDFSMELCGGTHVPRTGVIGYGKIVTEASIASGVRRIEAICGEPCVENIQSQGRQLNNTAQLLKTSLDSVEDRVKVLLEENRKLAKEVEKWKAAAAAGNIGELMAQTQDVNGIKVIAANVEGQDGKGLKSLIEKMRDKLGSGVIVLGSAGDGKVALNVCVTSDLTKQIKAGDIVKQVAPIVGGGGGGKPDMAQAGGKNPEKLPKALAQVPKIVAGLL